MPRTHRNTITNNDTEDDTTTLGTISLFMMGGPIAIAFVSFFIWLFYTAVSKSYEIFIEPDTHLVSKFLIIGAWMMFVGLILAGVEDSRKAARKRLKNAVDFE